MYGVFLPAEVVGTAALDGWVEKENVGLTSAGSLLCLLIIPRKKETGDLSPARLLA